MTRHAWGLGALAAALFMAGVVFFAPGWWFVRFTLEVIPSEKSDGADVVIQARRALYPLPFFAQWYAEIKALETTEEDGRVATVVELQCQGSGVGTYTWGETPIAAFRAPVSLWVGADECRLEPGGLYIAEATWRFMALGFERRVTTSSRPFRAGPVSQ